MSLLATDAYKFSMGEAGFPLRTETFVYSHRKGGPQVLPVDVRKFVTDLLPAPSSHSDYAFLNQHEYEMGIGYRTAMEMRNRLVVRSLPKGAVFFPGEPVFTVTGPSALVSWLEPLVLQLHYRIQVATLALYDLGRLAAEVATVTCQGQKTLLEELLDLLEVRHPKIEAQSDVYHRQTLDRVRALASTVMPSRIFEVGLRSATCMDQHGIALDACKQAGVTLTSNAFLASMQGLKPVGTMGHEHVQRYRSDEEAFRAMSDRRPYRSSYLLDTYDTFLSGIPAAFRLMAENRDRKDSIRYDSGNKRTQYLYAVEEARRIGIKPVHIIEDGLDLEETRAFERLRELTGVPAEDQFYGYGGWIVNPADSLLTRDRVAAVWKLSQSGPWPTMKFANDPGKESLPGRPVVFRRRSASGPVGIVGQEGERCPEGYSEETDGEENGWFPRQEHVLKGMGEKVVLSEATARLRERLTRERVQMRGKADEPS